MPELINHTEVFCRDCQCHHQARLTVERGRVIGLIDCPDGPKECLLSENAELFLRLRRQADFDPAFRAPEPRPFFFHHLPVTDDCNCSCPVCFADSGPKETNFYLSLTRADELARVAREQGARVILLVGGEPTLHPQLPDLIKQLRRAKLRVWLATNGLRIARKPDLARKLKEAGLDKVTLQLDSFQPEAHQAIRGHGRIAEKVAAARLVAAAGLDLGLVCTVTSHNLAELSSYCREVFSWESLPSTVIFQGAAHVGRLAVDQQRYITREEIVASLVQGQAVPGLRYADFWPIPVFRPLSVYVHPDCAANTMAVVGEHEVEAASSYADVDRFLALASGSAPERRTRARSRHLVALGLKCLTANGWKLLCRHAWDRILGRRGAKVVFIGTGAFLRPDFQDLGRVQRCGSGTLGESGCESLCSFHGKMPCNGM